MLWEALVIIFSFTVLFISVQIFYKLTRIPAEITRKIVHICSALLLVLLPMFFSWQSISLTALFFVAVMIVSQKLNILGSIHETSRTTYGEIYLPLTVFILASFKPDQVLFTYAILVLGIADMAAEIVGRKYGKKKIFHSKSLAGSLAFFVCAWTIGILVNSLFTNGSLLRSFLITSTIALISTLAEAISPKGLDNLTVPLSVYSVGMLLGA